MVMATRLMFRHARMEDAALLLGWRNDPVTREMSFNTRMITMEEHLTWLVQQLMGRSKWIYMALKNEQPVGVIRAEERGNIVELHITISPDHRGKGFSTLAILWMMERLSIKKKLFVARIKDINAPSIGAFLSAGFAEVARAEGIVTMCRAPSL